MRIVVIGAVAAGTSAAAKARRNMEKAEIVIYEKDSHISYSGCGMPYFIGGVVSDANELSPRGPEYFKRKYNIDVHILHEVLSISPDTKTLKVKDLVTGEEFDDNYDRLVIATGARVSVPKIKGIEADHVFTLRNINDMNRINEFIKKRTPRTSAVIGAGYIGLEMCENLKNRGMEVTLLERLPQIAPALDEDISADIRRHIEENNVTVLTGVEIDEIRKNSLILKDGGEIKADLVIVSAGVRPNTDLAKAAGIELGEAGAIRVNSRMQTSVQDIYSCGDCIEQFNLITGKPVYRPLGSTANKTGRIAGENITGGNLEFRGILGTGIFKIFDMTAGMTGLSEHEAIELGYEAAVCHNIKPNKPEYMQGRDMVIKAVADRKTGRLLGVQIVGYEGVDKRLDVFVTAISFNAGAEDLFHLDLSYAPPYSTVKDPVMYTGMILENDMHSGRPLITARELDELINSGERFNLIDIRDKGQHEENHIENDMLIPQEDLRDAVKSIDKDLTVITYCNRGISGNAAQNILIGNGFKKVYNLSGGYTQYKKNAQEIG